jgi:cytochrome c556
MNRLIRIGVAAAVATISVVAFAQMARPNPDQVAIDTRQSLMKLISNQFGPIGGMLRKQVPFDAAVVSRNAGRIAVLAGMAPELFARDTRQFKDMKTQALDGIWNSQAEFKTKADGMVTAVEALAATAKAGDEAATMKAAADAGKACGACHDDFKSKN